MKPVKSISFNVFLRLFVMLIAALLAGCGNGSYSSTPPGAESRERLAAQDASTPVPTTDAKVGYVFSDNIFTYQPCAPVPCPQKITVGNPVYSYAIDSVSGMPSPK